MCGLAGIVQPRGVDPAALVAMADALQHRGPDGEGYALVHGAETIELADRRRLEGRIAAPVRAGLAHRRLTIIDLSEASAQPMLDASGRLALAYNGELYNYVELRKELESLGETFRTSGDTEVMLRAWARWGAACLERFVGMWSFAILDLVRRELVLVRDRFGIKPLFFARSDRGFHFASEIKGLLATMPVPEPEETTVAGFLVAAVDTASQTFFAGIERVPPAHLLRCPLDDPSAIRLERYWTIPQAGADRDGDGSRRFRELFADSIRLHTRSDVPVGTCLSGGLDSSSIVCTAAVLHRTGVLPPTYHHCAFGYVPPDEAVSERAWMDLVVAHTGVELTEVRPSAEQFASTVAKVARQQDEPFGSTSIVAQWFVFEAAQAAGMKVMLDGQGADEVLGGYHGYLAAIAAGVLAGGRRLAFARLALDYRRRLGSWPVSSVTAAGLLPPRVRPIALLGAGRRSGPPAPGIDAVLSDRLRAAVPRSKPLPTELQALLRHQTQHALPSLLRYEDRNSMAHSIEARVPFLDHRLVELAFSLPADAKVRGADTKRLLRGAMRGILPEAIRTRRDKLGFRADPAAAARFAAAHRAELIVNATTVEDAWFRPDAVAALIDGAQKDVTLDFPLWRVINVKLWARRHWGDEVAA
jgi:asparagine synthase (glutamine-hydrolysing)